MLAERPLFVLLSAVGAALLPGCAVGAGDVPDGSLGVPTSVDGAVDAALDVAASGHDSTIDLDAGTDSHATGADADARVTEDAGAEGGTGGDGGRTDAVPPPADGGCALNDGFHLCGTACTPNGANDPSTGCALGCGNTPCASANGETASCTDAGACTSSCGSGTKMCSDGTCAACCTDSDCAANVTCVAGTCSGCAPDYGTCVTMCDTNLTTNDNCGYCGFQCDTGFGGGCGILGLGGCSCQGSGPPENWSCE